MENEELVSILLTHSNISLYQVIATSGEITESKVTLQSAIGRLMREGSAPGALAEVFEITDWQTTLDYVRQGKPQGPFPVKREYNSILNDASYFSIFPDYSCRLLPLSGRRVLFLVYYKRRFPLPDNNEAFFFDENNRIVALNQSFFALLSETHPAPETLLGCTLDELFRETPRQLAMGAMRQQDGEPGKSRVKEWGARAGWKGLLYSNSGDVIEEKECLRIRSTRKDFSLVTLPEEVDFSGTRVTFRMDFNSPGNTLPVFFFGTKGYSADRVLTPDASGFSLGPDGANRIFLLKKAGALLAGDPLPTLSMNKPHRLEISLSRNSIQCRLDNSTLFSFHTFNTYLNQKGYLNVGVRPEQQMDILRISLTRETVPNLSGPRSRDYLLEFIALPDRFFSISYLSSAGFSEGTLLTRGIELREVTDMQRRITFEQNNARRLHQKMKERSTRAPECGFIGNSAITRRLLDTAEILARANVTILLQGPTGAGKEVLARHIHDKSEVFDQPFVKMDCSTLPRDLFESVVFGHAKGAFTGAIADSEGLLESAGNGTLFIDEIQNLSLAAQAKLLAVLQDRRAARVGDTRSREIQARFIVGTNVNIETWIKQGSFRADLYYRINQASLLLPALRERKEDIPELCRHFILQYNREYNSRIAELPPACLGLLMNYEWPGNVRELKNVIFKAAIFSVQGHISEEQIRENLSSQNHGMGDDAGSVDAFEDRITRARLLEALKKSKGKAAQAAKLLQISRSSVYYNLKRYGLKP